MNKENPKKNNILTSHYKAKLLQSMQNNPQLKKKIEEMIQAKKN
jgi:hypothetical protein